GLWPHFAIERERGVIGDNDSLDFVHASMPLRRRAHRAAPCAVVAEQLRRQMGNQGTRAAALAARASSPRLETVFSEAREGGLRKPFQRSTPLVMPAPFQAITPSPASYSRGCTPGNTSC